MTACMLYKSPKSKLKFVTFDTESHMSMLWRREELLRMCSEDKGFSVIHPSP